MFKKIITYLSIFFLFSFYINSYANQNIVDNKIKIQSWLEKIDSWLYKCIKEKCKINLDIIWITDKQYNCIWDFWWGVFKTKNTDKKCNPWYVNYSKWRFEIKLSILNKDTKKEILKEKIIILNWVNKLIDKTLKYSDEVILNNQNNYSQEVYLKDNNIKKNILL